MLENQIPVTDNKSVYTTGLDNDELGCFAACCLLWLRPVLRLWLGNRLCNKTNLFRTTVTISIAFSNFSVVQIVCVLHLSLQNLHRLFSQRHVRWQLVKLIDRCKGGFNMWTHALNM